MSSSLRRIRRRQERQHDPYRPPDDPYCHSIPNARKGDPVAWSCHHCMMVTIQRPDEVPTCANCGAPACPECIEARAKELERMQ